MLLGVGVRIREISLEDSIERHAVVLVVNLTVISSEVGDLKIRITLEVLMGSEDGSGVTLRVVEVTIPV